VFVDPNDKESMTTLSRTGAIDQVRTAVRFPMQLGLLIRTEAGEIEAVTDNISANGILFTGKELPEVDSLIEFTITMPAAVMGTPEDVSVQCVGRVVRRSQQGEDMQAAAIIDEYSLRALADDGD
jgi:hypothetical protein